MGRYRKVDPRIWNDAKFRNMTDQGKLAFLFVLTHPHMTSLGAMRATLDGLAAELGWTTKAFREAFSEACFQGMVQHDEKASFIAFPNFLKFNPPESANVVKSWRDQWDNIPECESKNQLYHMVKAFLEAFDKGFLEAYLSRIASPGALPSPNPEHEHEHKHDTPIAPKGAESINSVFARLQERWNAIDGVTHCKSATDARLRKLKTRMATPGWAENVKPALAAVATSSFCKGENDRGWVADIDFLLKPDTVTKLVEGGYQGTNGHQDATDDTPTDYAIYPKRMKT